MKKIYILRLEALSISDDERLVRGDTRSRAATEREILESKLTLKEFLFKALGELCDRLGKPSGADNLLLHIIDEQSKQKKPS